MVYFQLEIYLFTHLMALTSIFFNDKYNNIVKRYLFLNQFGTK